MKRIDIPTNIFDSNLLSSPHGWQEVLDYVQQLQVELDRVNLELSTLKDQEDELRQMVLHYHDQLGVASQLQQDLLPRSIPLCAGLEFSKLYLPAHQLSGDMYDISRLSEKHLTINVSDATGHGVAAAMLSMLAKQSMQAKFKSLSDSGEIMPDKLLYMLNQDLVEADLSDCQFVTSFHGIYDETGRTLTWARGGTPYPILIRNGQAPRQLVSEGGLIGAFKDQQFDLVTTTLQPGDLFLVYTDGLEALLLNTPDTKVCPTVAQTPWCQQLSAANLDAQLAKIQTLVNHAPKGSWPIDDITVMVIQVTP